MPRDPNFECLENELRDMSAMAAAWGLTWAEFMATKNPLPDNVRSRIEDAEERRLATEYKPPEPYL